MSKGKAIQADRRMLWVTKVGKSLVCWRTWKETSILGAKRMRWPCMESGQDIRGQDKLTLIASPECKEGTFKLWSAVQWPPTTCDCYWIHLSVRLATLQVLSSLMQLVAVILDVEDMEYLHQCGKFHWVMLKRIKLVWICWRIAFAVVEQ